MHQRRENKKRRRRASSINRAPTTSELSVHKSRHIINIIRNRKQSENEKKNLRVKVLAKVSTRNELTAGGDIVVAR